MHASFELRNSEERKRGILNSHSHQTLLPVFYVCRICEYRITRTTQEKLFGKLETRTECYIEWMTRFIPKLRRSCEASERGKIDIGCCDEESSQTFVPTICFRGGTTLDYCHQDGTVIILSIFLVVHIMDVVVQRWTSHCYNTNNEVEDVIVPKEGTDVL